MWIGVDFDGTLVKETKDQLPPFELQPGAVEAIKAIRAGGDKVLIHSARGQDTTDRYYRDMLKFLKDNDIAHDGIWTMPGKPHFVDVFIDDRARRYDPSGANGMTWADVAGTYAKEAPDGKGE